MKTWLKSRRFFVQILTLTVSLLLILCIASISILYYNSQKYTSKSILQTESEHNADLMRQSNIYFHQMIYIGYSLTDMVVPYDSLITTNNFWTREVFDTMLDSLINSNNYISSIDVRIHDQSVYPSSVSHDRLLGELYNFQIWGADDLAWPYFFDLASENISQNNQVTLTLNGYRLSDQIFTFTEKDRLEYLLLPSGAVLLTNQRNAFFQNIGQLHPGLDLSPDTAGQGTIRSYGDYYFVYSKSDQYNFSILTMVPKSVYSEQYHAVILQAVLLAGCLILITILISLFLTNRFYRPIKNTIDLLQAYIPDDLHEYEDEIVFIQQQIIKYAHKNAAEATVSGNISRIQTAQAAVLQHQINAHFLFNTLENIRAISVAELGMQNEIETSILLLNTIIREGIFQKKIFVPLSHELHLAKCYLELMSLRFADVDVRWKLDESLSQCQVFKFSLQPILENCFTHAFSGSFDRRKTIDISVSRDEDALSILIKDNGRGLTEAESRQTATLLQSTEEDEPSSHVGIRNIHKRITETFGQNYGIRISSSEQGTAVEIRYPCVVTPPISNS